MGLAGIQRGRQGVEAGRVILKDAAGRQVFRFDDEFARGHMDVPVDLPSGLGFGDNLGARLCYFRSAKPTINEVVTNIVELGLDFGRDDEKTSAFFAWLGEQTVQSRGWYHGLIYLAYWELSEAHCDTAGRDPAIGLSERDYHELEKVGRARSGPANCVR